ncbi:MAG TPA: endo-1,3-alpha-glucanase family glycosylhydrolase [Gaiellaceae bacterium]|nr:endo-1,3-alpha-glucanase family glycosylhydrolase [Gaiellaceae bacterium]
MRRIGLIAALALACSVALAGPEPALSAKPIPAFAYYYIWYQPASWNRAKTTYPALGRYSSSDPTVIRKQIELAKHAGLSGFIVSWKSTRRLNARLARVVRIANAEHFKLALIYEGLDFNRNPLPVSRVESDLVYFLHRYGRNPAFNFDGKPIVVWSGTWKFSRSSIAAVSRLVRPRMLLLASEKSVDGYRRVRQFVDGDAYYWSSVNPQLDRWAGRKLDEMSQAIHDRGGLWIAPAAAGFDARQVGGRRIVPRLGGATLRAEWSTALASAPDLIGVISWNEYSENSEIEPTVAFGTRYLSTVADLTGGDFVFRGNFDSSSTPAHSSGYTTQFLVGGLVLLLACFGAVAWRREVGRAIEREE